MESNESISDGEIPVLKQQMIYVFYLTEIKKIYILTVDERNIEEQTFGKELGKYQYRF